MSTPNIKDPAPDKKGPDPRRPADPNKKPAAGPPPPPAPKAKETAQKAIDKQKAEQRKKDEQQKKEEDKQPKRYFVAAVVVDKDGRPVENAAFEVQGAGGGQSDRHGEIVQEVPKAGSFSVKLTAAPGVWELPAPKSVTAVEKVDPKSRAKIEVERMTPDWAVALARAAGEAAQKWQAGASFTDVSIPCAPRASGGKLAGPELKPVITSWGHELSPLYTKVKDAFATALDKAFTEWQSSVTIPDLAVFSALEIVCAPVSGEVQGRFRFFDLRWDRTLLRPAAVKARALEALGTTGEKPGVSELLEAALNDFCKLFEQWQMDASGTLQGSGPVPTWMPTAPHGRVIGGKASMAPGGLKGTFRSSGGWAKMDFAAYLGVPA